MHGAVIELVTHLGSLHSRDESEIMEAPYTPNNVSVVPSIFGISITSKLHSVVLEVDLANDGDNSSALMVSLNEMNMRYFTFVLLLFGNCYEHESSLVHFKAPHFIFSLWKIVCIAAILGKKIEMIWNVF